jgi:tetratricopeptide (TPR) repeat protein
LTPGEIERLIGNAGFWSIHLLKVSFWVLVALAAGLFLVRLALSRRAARSAPESAVSIPPRTLSGLAVGALAVFAAGVFLALRPDEHFYLTVADAAYAGGDCAKAAVYYEPLASWGTSRADVYARLGVCELKLRRFRAAARALESAVALEPARLKDTREMSGLAYLGLGDTATAIAHLEEAVALADAPGEKERLARLVAQVRGGRP